MSMDFGTCCFSVGDMTIVGGVGGWKGMERGGMDELLYKFAGGLGRGMMAFTWHDFNLCLWLFCTVILGEGRRGDDGVTGGLLDIAVDFHIVYRFFAGNDTRQQICCHNSIILRIPDDA